jgi:hypothetical protein
MFSHSKYIILKNITIKLIIYTVEAEAHHNNWNLNTETITNEIKTSDMLSVSDTEEFTNLLMSWWVLSQISADA